MSENFGKYLPEDIIEMLLESLLLDKIFCQSEKSGHITISYKI